MSKVVRALLFEISWGCHHMREPSKIAMACLKKDKWTQNKTLIIYQKQITLTSYIAKYGIFKQDPENVSWQLDYYNKDGLPSGYDFLRT